MSLIVFGNASQKTVKEIAISSQIISGEDQMTLMELLIVNGIPVASSCSGVNACKLCSVNESVISCQITVHDFINKYGHKVVLNYL
ncbi:MAG: hypothetical protein BM556_14580 [Bacteriovorax sp. MedPE-SWde]|nr:MAG: hypothetical protein BM556_14580 [Bacteriovorax sp. MedPE-SWde]